MPNQQRLKLLVISMMYEPDCVGIAAIASDMCASLVDRGHQVTVYTTYPFYPEWKLKSKASFWRVKQETINGVDVRRHRIFIPSNPSKLIPRIFYELSFALSLSRNLFRREKYDVVMVYCPLMGGVVFAGIRKLLRRDPLWVNIQDNPADAAAASGMIRSGLLRRFASGVQKLILNRADVWSSISPDMVERLKRIQSKDVPIHLCSNWLTKSLRDSIDPIPSKVGRVMQQPIKLLYCGTIGKKQGLLQFCEALAKCDLAFDFQIRGAGGESESVRQWIQHRGDSRFQFGELVSHSEFIDAIAGADWFVVPQLSSAGGAFFPSKLIPAISIGTPILAVSENEGPLYREVSENKIGLVVPWSRIERLADELATFQDSPDAFFQLQTNCLKRSATYESSNAIAHFEQLLQQHAFGLRSGAGNPIAVTQSDGHVPSVKHS